MKYKRFNWFKKREQGPFGFNNEGRCGSVVYKAGGRSKSLYWEMSGSKQIEILMAPLNLTLWDQPVGVKITKNEQLELLKKLRDYLTSINIRSDIHLPLELTKSSKKCVWKGCLSNCFQELNYCENHYNMLVIGTVQL